MRTAEFKPDVNGMEKRKSIVPFGRAAKYEVQEANHIQFILYTTEQDIKPVKSESGGIYQAVNMFRSNSEYKMQGEIPVRVTNIPTRISQTELFDLLMAQCRTSGVEILQIRPFTRLTLVLDKETRISKGLAYANCPDIDKAKELAKVIRNITIEEYVLCAEVLNN